MNNFFKKAGICLLIIFIAVTTIYFHRDNSAYGAEKSQGEVIKVGYVDIPNFIILNGTNSATGYGADYLNEISRYTGWRYKFIRGNWSDCLKWLEEGKVDLLFPAEKSREREKKFIFSEYPCCTDYIALLGRKDDQRLFYNDFSNYKGLTIGMIRGNSLNKTFDDKMRQKGVSYKKVYYANYTKLENALHKGHVDAIVNGNLNINHNTKLLAKISFTPAYFMMAEGNEKRMEELNRAIGKITLEDVNYNAQLEERYYGNVGSMVKGLSREESKYIDKSRPMRVVIDPDNFPFSWYEREEDKFCGISVDVLDNVSRNTGLKTRFIKTKSLSESWEKINKGEADIILGIFDNASAPRGDSISLTKPYTSDYCIGISLKRKNLDSSNPFTIALPREMVPIKKYIQSLFPNSDIVEAATEESCINMVRGGKADITLISSLRIYTDYNYTETNGVEIMPAITADIPMHIGVSGKSPQMLIDILNKGIAMIDDDVMEEIRVNNSVGKNGFSMISFVRERPVDSAIMLILLCGLIFLLIFLAFANKAKRTKEMLLRENNKNLVMANNTKTAFMQRMSHDMRTPMNGIIGLTELSLNRGDVQGEIRENLEGIKSSGMFLLKLVNDVLDLNKADSDGIEFENEDFDLAEAIQRVDVIFRPVAEEKKVRFNVTKNFEHCWLRGDAMRIQQIMTNIISNGIKFTLEGGQVQLDVRSEELCDSERITLTCRDNGIGISETFLGRIFHPFEREDKVRLAQIEGSGLGMPIVKKLLDAMGGSIAIYSNPDEGTEVVIEMVMDKGLPRPSTDSSAVNLDKYKRSLGGKRFLVCEDQLINRTIAVKLLVNVQATVYETKNGLECLDLIAKSRENAFDCILMDIRMPVMDGLTAAKAIRNMAREDVRRIPIIALSANAFDDDIREAEAAGMDDYITKPIDMRSFYEVLDRYV